MDYTKSLSIQNVITNLQDDSMVDSDECEEFVVIRHTAGNEDKIARIVEALKLWLHENKYFKDGMLDEEHEEDLRKFVLLFIANTDLENKSLLNPKIQRHSYILPKFSKFLLTTVIFNLGLYEYYGDAITSLPMEISLELLENCNNYIAKADPYLILKQTSAIARSIYFKVYHMRYEREDKFLKVLDKFCVILKNYITPVTDKLMNWPTVKMYQYMGLAIYEILKLVKICFTVFHMETFIAPYYKSYLFSPTSGVRIYSSLALEESVSILKNCNKTLISICEENIAAVSVDVFCSWVECKKDCLTLQQAICALAYDVNEQIKLFDAEDTGDLPQMLSSIAIKFETIIKNADESTILENVVIKSENQPKWYKALINHGILHSEESFNVFKSVVHLSDENDYINILSLNKSDVKLEFDLKNFMLDHLYAMPETESIKIIGLYFSKVGLNNNYETDKYDYKLRTFFNQLNCSDKQNISLKDVSTFMFQNPIKFIPHLLSESIKHIDQLVNILYIFQFIQPVCVISLPNSENSILHEVAMQQLQKTTLIPKVEKNFIQLIVKLIDCKLLTNKIVDDARSIFNQSITNNEWKRATFICQLCKELSTWIISSDNSVSIILEFNSTINKIRWNFLTYCEERRTLVTEIIQFIYYLKNNLSPELNVELNKAAENLDKINSYHITRDLKSISNDFLSYLYPGYDVNGNNNEQVCRLMKLLPSCAPLEWELTAKYLIIKRNALSVLNLFIDVMLVLSEISKKSPDNQSCLSYCFQQFCVIVRDIIYPLIKQHKENEKDFIKNVCKLIKHLPNELHNSEFSLVYLFDSKVLKSLKKDEEFLRILISLADFEICKGICTKMAS